MTYIYIYVRDSYDPSSQALPEDPVYYATVAQTGAATSIKVNKPLLYIFN